MVGCQIDKTILIYHSQNRSELKIKYTRDTIGSILIIMFYNMVIVQYIDIYSLQ